MRHLTALALVLSFTIASPAANQAANTYKPDEEGYIRNWLVLEPIKLTEDVSAHTEEQEKPVFDKDFVKKDHAPKADDKLKAGDLEVEWIAKESADPILDLTAAFEGKDNQQCLYLGVVYVVADKDYADVKLSIGSDDSSLWKVNGKEVVRVYAQRSAEKDTDQSQPLALKKGVNTLQFAVIQGDGPAAAAARFVDKDGKPLTNLIISLQK